MISLEIAGLAIFIVILFIGLFSIIFGLPGTIIILIDVIIYSLISGSGKIGWKTIFVLMIITLIAEALDFILGVAGAKKFGSSKKGIAASLIGGMTGAILMAPLLFGLGAVIGAFAGGFAGAFLVEFTERKKLKPAVRAGYGALLGRVAGVAAKGFLAVVMIVITLSAIY